jgi:diguanylate cyclase (GGDEF)-like protein
MPPDNNQKYSFWLKLWQPFFRLSIYGKFFIVLTSFLLGFTVIGLFNLYFIHELKNQLSHLSIGTGSDLITQAIQDADIYLRNGTILVSVLMFFLSLTSFLCIRILVNLLKEMTTKLKELRLNGGSAHGCQQTSAIPIITNDEIGTIAETVNGLISDICNISRFRRTIEADETTDEVYRRLAYVFRERLNLPSFVIWELSENGDVIKPAYTWPQEMESEICQMSAGSICRAKRTGEIISSSGYPGLCPVFPQADVMTHSCIPMMVGGQILGVVQFLFLFVDSKQRQEHLAHNLQRAQQYLREALPVLHAKRLADNLQEMATRDTLTGLHNRRFLESNITPLISGIKRRKSHMAVLMCDMDFFKKVNDEHGHEAGDIVLKGLAHTLQNCCRSSDLIVRYGGEEFLILLVDCDPKTAMEVAEKIRLNVEDQQFRFEGVSLRKTLSIGVSQFPGDTSAFWECVKFADVALYQAKETGRNRVIRFNPEMWDSSDY